MRTITFRQAQVLQAAAEGYSNTEIGERLHLSKNSVKTYLVRARETLNARDRTHAVAIAYQLGVLPMAKPLATSQVVIAGYVVVERPGKAYSTIREAFAARRQLDAVDARNRRTSPCRKICALVLEKEKESGDA